MYRRPAHSTSPSLSRLAFSGALHLPKDAAAMSAHERRTVLALAVRDHRVLACLGLGRRERLALLMDHARRLYPVDDYELWLCSDRPLFDILLARRIDPDLVRRAAAGVDAGADVDPVGDRALRVAIPPVRVSSRDSGRLRFGGDRDRLRRFLDRVVDPLHADVGVVRVDMGGTLSRRA